MGINTEEYSFKNYFAKVLISRDYMGWNVAGRAP